MHKSVVEERPSPKASSLSTHMTPGWKDSFLIFLGIWKDSKMEVVTLRCYKMLVQTLKKLHVLLLMAEILHHLGWCWNPRNNGINYTPKLVIRISGTHQQLVNNETSKNTTKLNRRPAPFNGCFWFPYKVGSVAYNPQRKAIYRWYGI